MIEGGAESFAVISKPRAESVPKMSSKQQDDGATGSADGGMSANEATFLLECLKNTKGAMTVSPVLNVTLFCHLIHIYHPLYCGFCRSTSLSFGPRFLGFIQCVPVDIVLDM